MGEAGHAVVVDALRQYSGKLSGDVQVPTELAQLTRQADVGNESWGIVGLFVKSKYTEMLGDLQDMFTEMANGLTAAAEKLGGAAEIYDKYENDTTKGLNDILNLLEKPAASRTPQIGPAK